LKKIDGFDDRSSVQTWISAIAKNIEIDRLRRAKREDEEVPESDWANASSFKMLDAYKRAVLIEAFKELPDRQKAAVQLRISGFELKEIAVQLGISVSQVSKDLHKAGTTFLHATG